MTSLAAFAVVETGDVCVGRLSGDVDVSNAADVATEILAVLTNEPIALVLDLSDVEYLDSSGVALLFGLIRSLDVRRQRLVLVVPAVSPLGRLLRITKLPQVVRVESDLEAAKSAARGPVADGHSVPDGSDGPLTQRP